MLLPFPGKRLLILTIVLVFALQNGCRQVDSSPSPPNFILIFTDELQFSDLSCYGGTIPTPNIDRLAAEGLRFTRAYTPASMCTPSRFAVLTGQFPGRCTSTSFLTSNPRAEPYSIAWNTWLTQDTETLPKLLAQNGYFTGMSGKWHVGEKPEAAEVPQFDRSDDPASPEVQEKLAVLQSTYETWVKTYGGFDFAASVIWSNFDNHPVDALRFHNFPWITKGAMEFLDEAAQKDQPFFLYLTPTAIHGPNHVADLDMDVTLTPDGKRTDVLPFQPDINALKSNLENQKGGQKHRYAGISQIDHQLGWVRAKLDSLNLADNTVILFMADHNIEPGKATSYEKGIHIPFIAYWPGEQPNRTSPALVQNVDILPTILEAAGVTSEQAAKKDGTSILPIIKDHTAQIRDYVFSENGYTRSVSNERYKYIALRYPKSLVEAMESGDLPHVPSYVKAWPQAHSAIAIQAFPSYFDQDQLYDLEQDPYELNNLAGEESISDIQTELKQALKGHLNTFDHPFSMEPIPFLDTPAYQELTTVNRSFDLFSIPWLRRDHGGITWPPEKQ